VAYSEKYLVASSHPYLRPVLPSENNIPKRTFARVLPCAAALSSRTYPSSIPTPFSSPLIMAAPMR